MARVSRKEMPVSSLSPPILPLEGAAEGLRLIQDRKVIGKVVLTTDD